MHTPSHQAKLVFLGLLRTASALASTEPRVLAEAAWHGNTAWQQHQEQQSANVWRKQSSPALTLRLARRTDVPAIQRCNLETLPENYNAAFYAQHLRQWPELSLVVVEEENNNNNNNKKQPPLSFSPFPPAPTDHVVAYVLGKVEEQRIQELPPSQDDNHSNNDYWPNHNNGRPVFRTSYTGHVTSLAVLEDYRRRGLAAAMLQQLHHQLQQEHPAVSCVGLHVRQSNAAATVLYERAGYYCRQEIGDYYQDGEDGYYMVKNLESQQQVPSSSSEQRSNGGGLFGARSGKNSRSTTGNNNNPFLMPRTVGRRPLEEEQQPELLSGTM